MSGPFGGGGYLKPQCDYAKEIDYDGSGNVLYIGLALPGSSKASAAWKISKLSYSGTDVTEILWADGNTLFDNVWNNRATYIYS